MVKTKGPLLAASASGCVGQLLLFSTAPDRTILKTRPRTLRPPTRPQLAYRVWMAWLTRAWTPLTAAEKATWTALAGEHQLSPYHMFLKHNSDRWSHGQHPSTRYPATQTGNEPGVDGAEAAVGRHFCQVKIYVVNVPTDWLLTLYRSTGPFYPQHQRLAVACATGLTGELIPLIDNTALPGVTYRYELSIGSTTGKPYLHPDSWTLTATN